MDDITLIAHHDAAYSKAQSCPVYAPPQSVAPSEALYHATRSGVRSAACADEWGRLYDEMKKRGLSSTSYPHLFKDRYRD